MILEEDIGDKETNKHDSFSSEETVSFSNFKVSLLDRKVPLLLLVVLILFILLISVSVYALVISLKRLGYGSTYRPIDVQTNCGIIRGVKEHGIIQYRGIPYALPPIANRRFRKPVELSTNALCEEAWNISDHIQRKVLPALHFRSICMQLTPITDILIGEEDCLYLNVFAPEEHDPIILNPVIIIIGGFFFNYGGASNASAFAYQPDPQNIANINAIHVTLNYRLGPLGFLPHPSTNETNLGIRDLFAAVRWVRANIRQFGGDPLKITLFSYGSGATISLALLSSPLAQHTFDKVWISAPDLAAPTITPFEAFVASQEVFDCSKISCPLTGEQITQLWNWSIFKPWIEQKFSLASSTNRACLPGLPCDGGILVADGELIHANDWGQPLFPLDIAIGQNSHEVEAYTSPNTVRLWSPEAMATFLQTVFGENSPQFKLISSYYQLSSLSSSPRNDTSPFSPVEDTFTQIVTDIRVTCPIQEYSNRLRRIQPLHRYFIRSQHVRFDPYGLDSFVSSAFHGWDAFMFFKTYQKHPDYRYAANGDSLNVDALSQNYCNAVKEFVWHGLTKQMDNLTVFENSIVYSSRQDELSMCTQWNKLLLEVPFSYAWKA